jgi:hypothetical protein
MRDLSADAVCTYFPYGFSTPPAIPREYWVVLSLKVCAEAGCWRPMRLLAFAILLGLLVSGFNAELRQIAPTGWWGGSIPSPVSSAPLNWDQNCITKPH